MWAQAILIATLAAVLVMRKSLNKLHSVEQTQSKMKRDDDMAESEKPAKATIVVDHDPEKVNILHTLQ